MAGETPRPRPLVLVARLPALGLGFLLLLLPAARPAAGQEAHTGPDGSEKPSRVEPGPDAPTLFRTSAICVVCHDGIVTPAGEDASFGSDWRGSMMANSARDPYWQAAVRRETMDHPEARHEIENECSICHMPMARSRAVAAGGKGRIFDHLPVGAPAAGLQARLAADGVSCSLCHQVRADGLGERESFTGGFVIDAETPDGARELFGPFAVDSGRARVMRSASGFDPAEADHLASSELCGSCHTLFTHTRGAGGAVTDTLPEQMPFLEWRHGAYAHAQSCQDCHMLVVPDSTAIAGVLGTPRTDVSRHVFRGGNFFVLAMLNRYRDELGVVATPAELDAAARRTRENLESRAARVEVTRVRLVDGRLEADVEVSNLAGHKLPTAYPSRRAWLHLTVTDADGAPVFESGGLTDGARIAGNDNDDDPARFEPHHEEIGSPGQVQVYEAIMVGPDDGVTTGLLTAVRYVKDSRLLPDGFDKATAPPEVAVHGGAATDPDFRAGGDRVRYAVRVDPARGPFTVEAELLFQPIAWRWARNLADCDAFETNRFVRWFDEMADVATVQLAADAASTGP